MPALREDGFSGSHECVCLTPDEQTLVVGMEDGETRLVSVFDGTVRTSRLHQHSIAHVVVSPCGTRFATASKDDTVCVWNIDSACESQLSLIAPERFEPYACGFTPDGNGLLCLSDFGSVSLWDVSRKFSQYRELDLNASAVVTDGTSLIMRGDHSLVIGNESYDRKLWQIWRLSGGQARLVAYHDEEWTMLDNSCEETQLAHTFASLPGSALSKALFHYPIRPVMMLCSDRVSYVSQTSGRVALFDGHSQVSFYDLFSGRHVASFDGDGVIGAPDEQRAAITSRNAISIVDIDDGNEICSVTTVGEPRWLAFSADSKELCFVTHPQNQTWLWQWEKGEPALYADVPFRPQDIVNNREFLLTCSEQETVIVRREDLVPVAWFPASFVGAGFPAASAMHPTQNLWCGCHSTNLRAFELMEEC